MKEQTLEAGPNQGECLGVDTGDVVVGQVEMAEGREAGELVIMIIEIIIIIIIIIITIITWYSRRWRR